MGIKSFSPEWDNFQWMQRFFQDNESYFSLINQTLIAMPSTIAAIDFSALFNFSDSFSQRIDLDGISSALSSLCDWSQQIDIAGISSSLNALSHQFDISGLHTALENLNTLSSDISASIAALQPESNCLLLDSVIDAIEHAEPYLPHEIKDAHHEDIPVLDKHTPRTHLTLGELLALLSLLVTIYFGIISNLPNEQLERIADQNDTIIEQQAEQQTENEALLDALNRLTDSIDLLNDEVEQLREELESAKDSGNISGQDDSEDTQQQDSDTQN